jgi:membrane protease YdiL (CAAX protease family)
MTAAVALWPLLRGVTWPQLREALGWHRGKGILLEIAMGAWGYAAGLPVIGIAFFITSLLLKYSHTQSTHPITEEFTAGMSLAKIFGLLISAAVCAPLLEETIFRGALYGHLRRRWAPWISAGVVALVFAAMHPQGWAAIPVLGSIALVLAALREWRGSLVASMTAHAINNGLLVIFMAMALK